MLPNFLGIGVQRSATTWLYECLREHPQIFLPDKKELHFFDENFDKGLEWYESFFDRVTNETAIGEITPDYLYNYKALERMASVLPKAKLIVSLRNPVDRAYSAYRLLVANVYNRQVSFHEAFWQEDYIREVGFYYKHLVYLYNLYPRDQVFVFLYDDILASPEQVLRAIYVFLGVDSSFRPSSLTKKYNKVLFPRLQKFFISIGLGSFLDLLKKSKYGDWIKELFFYFENQKKVKRPQIDYSRYIEVYKEDILNLEKLINRDLSSWIRIDRHIE